MSLTVEVLRSDNGNCRIELSGRLDTATTLEFDQKIESVDCSAHPVQIVDLSALDYISSAGLRSLFKAKKRAHAAGAQLLLVNPQPQVRKVFDIVKALPKESVFTSDQELDAYLDKMQRTSS
ncbi:MAG: STAS domain-containing protein [Vulcanimicrobiota bacterium]